MLVENRLRFGTRQTQNRRVSRQTINFGAASKERLNKVYVAIVSHLHQPERDITPHGPQLNNHGSYGYLFDNSSGNKMACYDGWPAHKASQHVPVHVTMTRSLVNVLKKFGHFLGENNLADARNQKTSRGNSFLDFITMPAYHSLAGYIASGKGHEDLDTELQLKLYNRTIRKTFAGSPSKIFFPTEMAASERLIPAADGAGMKAMLVENSHINRANIDCPKNDEAVINPGNGEFSEKACHKGPAPNKSDMRNPKAEHYVAPRSKDGSLPPTSGMSLRPHWAEYVDPDTGKSSKMFIIPVDTGVSPTGQHGDVNAAMKIINEYKNQLGAGATKEGELPPLIVLASDGDNYGSCGDRYWEYFMNSIKGSKDVEMVAMHDYMDEFAEEIEKAKNVNVVHFEDGAWEGAAVDPQFAHVSHWDERWTRSNLWKELVAAKNDVLTAEALEKHTEGDAGLDNIGDLTGTDTDKAWGHLLVGQTSCYEYYGDGMTEYRNNVGYCAANAKKFAQNVIERHKGEAGFDKVGPTVSLPLRYDISGNKNTTNWNFWTPGVEGFTVRTWAYDYSGIAKNDVKLKIRKVDVKDGGELGQDKMLLTYTGKQGKTTEWQDLEMNGKLVGYDKTEKPMEECPPHNNEALLYEGKINEDVITDYLGEKEDGVMLQYYVEAKDKGGNLTKSPIQSVWVDNEVKSGGGSVSLIPLKPEKIADFKAGFTTSHENKVVHLWGSGDKWSKYLEQTKKEHPELMGSDGKSLDIPLKPGEHADKKNRKKPIAVLDMPDIKILKGEKISYMFKTGANGWDNSSIRENGLEIK